MSDLLMTCVEKQLEIALTEVGQLQGKLDQLLITLDQEEAAVREVRCALPQDDPLRYKLLDVEKMLHLAAIGTKL